jgi:hypothetical protein
MAGLITPSLIALLTGNNSGFNSLHIPRLPMDCYVPGRYRYCRQHKKYDFNEGLSIPTQNEDQYPAFHKGISET